MKKIVLVKFENACNPEVNSIDDVLEFVCAPHEDDNECEHKTKKKSNGSNLSKESLEVISAIAKDLGIDAEQLKSRYLKEKMKAEAAASKANKSKPYTAYENGIYETGAIDGYEKGFKDAIKFISSRLNKSLTATLSDLNDMAKWNFKDGTLKEDAVFKK